tara:strand:+ start:728 stop:1891 length:1164 start_codon:yes stop_codon:yes gene_type:complete
MLRKIFPVVQISSQLKSSSWLTSLLVHVALVIALSEVYIAKINHKNDELKTFEFVIYQLEPNKLPQKEFPKDIAKAISKVSSKTVSKHSVVSKPDIISQDKIVSQSKSVSEPKVLSLEILKNRLKTIPKPNSTIIEKETVLTRNLSQQTALTDASSSNLESKKPEYKDKNASKYESANNDKTDLDEKLSSQFEKPAQQNLRLVNVSESKSPSTQMGVSLNKTLATAPDTEKIQTKIFESKKSDNLGKINNKQNFIVDLPENTVSTKTDSMNSVLYNKNQIIISQTKLFTSTTESVIRKKLLKNWAATIRNDIVERTLESKLRSDVRISLKISRTGEILNIETIGISINNESIETFIDVIRKSGKFPMAPQGLKLDYVTFPVNFRNRG